MYKDISIICEIVQQNFSLNADIKSGNNASEVFKGLIGILPLQEDYQPYKAINTNVLTLPKL